MSTPDRVRAGRLADIRRGATVSAVLPLHGAVYAVSGRIWLTQEGLYEDVMLAPFERFDVERKGLIVINAIDEAALVYLASPPAHTAHGLPAEFHEAVIAQAKALRSRELARLAALAGASLARITRRAWHILRARFQNDYHPGDAAGGLHEEQHQSRVRGGADRRGAHRGPVRRGRDALRAEQAG